jgi:small subunit ribosomal protein S15
MVLSLTDKSKIIGSYQQRSGDTGSVEVQIALLTSRIQQLTGHLKSHSKDHASRRGLLMMVGRRSTLLKYLRRANEDKYLEMIQKLGLRR